VGKRNVRNSNACLAQRVYAKHTASTSTQRADETQGL
jgi:hypothetical protein